MPFIFQDIYFIIEYLKIVKKPYKLVSQKKKEILQLLNISEDQIVWYGDNRASQIQNSVFSNYKEDIFQPQQIGQTQSNWDQSQQSKVPF